MTLTIGKKDNPLVIVSNANSFINDSAKDIQTQTDHKSISLALDKSDDKKVGLIFKKDS